MRVLCLDIEGGYGGSSRSLYESLRAIDRSAVSVEVWCRRDGPNRPRYEALGIPYRIVPGMPKMNSLPRFSRNVHGYAALFRDFLRWRGPRAELLRAMADRFDLIHFNHEGLFCLANWLRGRHDKAQTMHVRTLIWDNVFGHWQARRMIASNDRLIFITENEKANVKRLAGRTAQGPVIYNIAPPPQASTRNPDVPVDRRLKIAILSNYAWIRGIDRAVEVAELLAARGRRDVLFVVAGDMQMRGSLPGELANFSGRTLADYAAARSVADMFLFLGYVADVDSVLLACDVLFKPTRDNNPWGRDILEALAAGKPAISVGSYDRFITTGETGFLLAQYDRSTVADIILRLDGDRNLIRQLGDNASARIASLCDGSERARDLVTIWHEAIAARREGVTA